MRALRFFCAVLVALFVLAGCPAPDRHNDDWWTGPGGTGGAPITTSTPGGGDLFDPDVVEDIPCCLDLGPFQRLSFYTESDAPCPDGTVEGDTLRSDFLAPPPHTCSCTCSEPACTLPGGIHTSSAKCAGLDGSAALPFGPAAGWDGTCSAEDPLPGGIECGGVPCVQSVTVPALPVSGCEPSGPAVSLPDPAWGRTARECRPALSGAGCEPGQVCPPEPPGGFDLCLSADGELDCPPGWYGSVFYRDLEDDRGCEACACGAPGGTQCEAYVVAYSGSACDAPVGSVTVTVDEPACFDVPSGTALGSVEASLLVQAPGGCAPAGGAPVGAVVPSGPVTLCCRHSLAVPG